MSAEAKQFLVTTHEHATWPNGVPLILIDSGISQAASTQTVARTTQLCPIGERLQRHSQLSKLCDELLPDIAGYLNKLHNEEKDHGLWKLTIGLWLHHFVDTVYERWLAISEIEEQFKGINTQVFTTDAARICPQQCFDFYPISQTAQWNHWVSGAIAAYRGNIAIVEATDPHHWFGAVKTDHLSQVRTRGPRHFFRSALQYVGLLSPHILATTYLPRRTELALALRLRSLPTIWHELQLIKIPFAEELRNSVTFPQRADGSFNAFIRTIICQQIPRTMIEEYSTIATRVSKGRYARTPRTIFTSNLHVTSDQFSIWLSQKRVQGSRIVLGQHGGQYGQVAPPTRTEEHEIATSDKYFTWGWRTPSRHVVAAPALTLINRATPEVSFNAKSVLLLITDCTSRYARRPWSINDDNALYINNLFSLVHHVPATIRSNLIVRLHHDHEKYDFDHLSRWNDQFPNLQIDVGVSPLDELRSKSRIIICTSLGTSELEQLAANQPTIWLLDKGVHPIRESESEVFSKLEDSNLLFRTADELGLFLDTVWHDVDRWWSSPMVNDAISLYQEHFVKQVNDPVTFFVNEITTACSD